MSKKRNKKRNQIHSNQNNLRLRFQKKMNGVTKKVDELFGNDIIDYEKMLVKNGWKEENELDRIKLWNEGELEWEKKLKIMFENKEKINELLHYLNTSPSLFGQGKEVFKQLILLHFYNPYEIYGNKTKWWFSEFYDWISELEIPKVFKGKNGLSVLFRTMEKSEFLNQLENGVQGMSWSPDFTNSSMWIRKHFFSKPNSENDKMMIVCGLFPQDGIILKKGENGLTFSKEEDEVWIRKGYKPIQTFTCGEYGWNEFINPYSKDISKNINKIRTLYQGTNGFIGHGTTQKTIESQEEKLNGKHLITEKLFGTEIEKLTRKIMKSRLVKSQKEKNNHLFVQDMENDCKTMIDYSKKYMSIMRENYPTLYK